MKHIRFFSRLAVCLVVCLALFTFNTKGQLSFTGNGTQTINFSTTISGVSNGVYTASGFSQTPSAGQLDSDAWAVTGWSDGNLNFGGTQTTANTDYTRGAVATAQTQGGFYAYTGSPGSPANPSFMIQPGTNDFATGTLTLRIQNNNASVNIIQFDISYNIFVRNDQERGNSLNLSYSTDNITYIPLSSLDYTTPQASDGLGYVQVGMSPSRATMIPGLNIAPGGFFYFRWSSADVNGSGSRDEISLDDIEIAATYQSTAASGTIAGRVKDFKGNGLKFVTVMITGNGLPEPLYATTNNLGWYQFEGIPVGNDYVLQVFSRRYAFQQSSLIVNLTDTINDADFVGSEER